MEQKTIPDEKLIQKVFSFNMGNEIINGFIQNLKLLIVNGHLNREISQKIIDKVSIFIDNNDCKNTVFDLLNTFCLFNDEKEINEFIFNSNHTEKIFDTIHFEFNELSKIMLYYNKQLFVDKLSLLLNQSPLESLLFLNNGKIIENDEDELSEFHPFSIKKEENYIIDKLINEPTKDFQVKIINPILALANNENSDIL